MPINLQLEGALVGWKTTINVFTNLSADEVDLAFGVTFKYDPSWKESDEQTTETLSPLLCLDISCKLSINGIEAPSGKNHFFVSDLFTGDLISMSKKDKGYFEYRCRFFDGRA